jgi:hypothetical protein
MTVRSGDFESPVSANSTTRATKLEGQVIMRYRLRSRQAGIFFSVN